MALKKSREKEDLGNNQAKIKRFTIGDLVIPLLGLFILLMLTIFVYVPMIFTGENSYMSMREERKEIDSKKRELDKKLEQMKPVTENAGNLTRDLRTVNSIIPNSLDVSDFTYYVDRLAQQTGLDFKEISSGNISVDTSDDRNESVPTSVSGVSGPIVYEGKYSEIVDFLDKLQSESPYIVETSNIFLKLITPARSGESVDESYWRVEISITGYYIATADGGEILFNAYQPFVPYTRYEDILEIFRFKAGLLEEGDTVE